MSDCDFDIERADPLSYRFELQRRDFLRLLSAMGGGLLIASVPVAAQEPGRSGSAEATGLASWIHIAGDGRVTVNTGKVEIGQNIRTSLAQTVADELRVPFASVAMQMCDTDLVPFDMGTFGSRTTPTMAPQLAKAAATARELLLDRAAQKWSVNRADLVAADGRISTRDGRSAGYGELTQDAPLVGVVNESIPLSPRSTWRYRGTEVPKVDGRSFVTGRHQFTSDVARPGMVYGRVVRPDSNGATLGTVDDRGARAIPGVSVVVDGNFVGVVAPTERAASRAAAAVRATWQPKLGQPTSDTLYEYLRKTAQQGGSEGPQGAGLVTGDVRAGRASAARVFEASYRIPYIAHVSLEPRTAVAEWTNGKLTVWTVTQRPFAVREELARTFRVPESQVRVIVPDMGSGFGGKHTAEHAIEAARLARAAARPVKIVWTRAEEFAWGYFRPAGVIDVKAGVDAQRRLTFWEFDNINSGPAGLRSPYAVPNQRIQYHPADSPFRQGSYRGLAATANHYVREMHIDAIARALAVDPVEFRLRHLEDSRVRAVLTSVAERVKWPPRAEAGRAFGIACGFEKGSVVATAAEVVKTSNGFRVERIIEAFECGAVANPNGLRNQIEGAIVQGLGGALFEQIRFADGKLLNGTMAKYRVPRFQDVPALDLIVIDRPDQPSAGAGETPIVTVAPAIGAAVRAFGEVETELPIRLKT